MTAFLFRHRDQLALLGILGLIVALFGSLNSGFLSGATVASLSSRIPTLTLAATGMTLVLIIGGIDLSVGSVLALSGAVLGMLITERSWSLPSAVAACLATGLMAGLFNGLMAERLRVPSFIVTLGTLEAARGLAYVCTDSRTLYLSGRLEMLVRPMGATLIPPVLVVALSIVAAAQFVLSRTVVGRKMVAIGTNETAAVLAGISTLPVKVAVFGISGLLAALASVCQLARLGACDPNAGSGLELAAIAAAVIGGTSLSGGRGSVISTFLGVLIIATLEAGLARIGASEPVKRIVTGTVIVAAVLLDTWRRKRTG